MASIDLTLNGIKIPALDGYTPPFGTKKVSGGLSTQEVNDNVIAPFVKQRPVEITENSSTGSVEYNACLVINQAGATLTLGSGSFIGCVVKVIAATAGSVSYNSGTTDTLVAGQIVNYTWTGSAWISDIALVHKSIASSDNALDIDKKDVHATYSTTEQPTGDYWIDGKPIYRKVVTGLPMPTITTEGTSLGLTTNAATGVATVIDYRGYCIHDGYPNTLPWEWASNGDINFGTFRVSVDSSNNCIVSTISNRSYFNSDTVTVILEYTKTTD